MHVSRIALSLLALSSPALLAYPEATAKPENTEEANPLENTKDFINFTNDDTLHGKFLGFTTSGKIIWKNNAAEKNIAFLAKDVRKVVLNEGDIVKPFSHSSFITLTNQDTVPGAITEISAKSVTLKTDYAGEIQVPRNVISSIDFLPLGSKIQYRGPFSEKNWNNLPYSYSTNSKSNDKPAEDGKPTWTFKNFSWNNHGKSGILMHEDDFLDKSRYTFKVTTKNGVMPSFVVAADMTVPEVKKDEQGKAVLPKSRSANIAKVIGTSLVLKLHYYSPSLSFYSFDEDGNPFVQNLTNMIQTSSRQRNEHTVFDVRLDKAAGHLLLYSKGAMIARWDISANAEKLKGNKIGFANVYSSSSNIYTISDVVVSSWNGVIDPATSMENNDRDTILLTNGTDRYSGKVLGIEDNKLHLKGPYAELFIPTDKIQSLFFAKKDREELRDKLDGEVSVRFYGSGRLTGTLSKGSDGKILLDSEVLGKLNIDLEYVSSYEFEDMDYAYEIMQ